MLRKCDVASGFEPKPQTLRPGKIRTPNHFLPQALNPKDSNPTLPFESPAVLLAKKSKPFRKPLVT